ncbi:MAG: alcohol dehydrogenase catalytic domain-containing protein [Chloroflexota bacterium]
MPLIANGKMRAVILRKKGPPEVYKVETTDIPMPGERQVLVRVRACGICNHEVVVRSPDVPHHSFHPPQIQGHEIAGEVVALGPSAGDFKVGDRVTAINRKSCRYCDRCRRGDETHCPNESLNEGGYGEFAALNEETLLRIPEAMPFEHACLAGCAMGIAYRSVAITAHVIPGETVLVTGPGGGIGAHAVEIAKLVGAQVVAVTRSPSKIPQVKALGADYVIATEGQPFFRKVEEVLGRKFGVNAVIDTVGSAVFDSAFRTLDYQGRYVFVGEFTHSVIQFNIPWMFRKDNILMGSGPARKWEAQTCLDLMARGLIKPLVAKTYPLERVAEAHREMEAMNHVGRLVITP